MFEYSLAMPSSFRKNIPCGARALLKLKISTWPPLSALLFLGAVLFGSHAWCAETPASQISPPPVAADVSHNETPSPDLSAVEEPQGDQTQTPPDHPTNPPAAEPPATPTVSEKIPGVALYNMLQKKSIVFPDIAASNHRLSSAQKFQLF